MHERSVISIPQDGLGGPRRPCDKIAPEMSITSNNQSVNVGMNETGYRKSQYQRVKRGEARTNTFLESNHTRYQKNQIKSLLQLTLGGCDGPIFPHLPELQWHRLFLLEFWIPNTRRGRDGETRFIMPQEGKNRMFYALLFSFLGLLISRRCFCSISRGEQR